MKKYEVMYIINSGIEEEARKQIVDRMSEIVSTGGGNVEKIDDWGVKKLAYPINYMTEGHYILMWMEAPPELPLELERNMKNNESIIRFLTTCREA